MVVGKISSQMRPISSDVKLTSPFTMSNWYLLISREYLGVIASGTPIHGKLLQSSGIDQGIESLLFTSE